MFIECKKNDKKPTLHQLFQALGDPTRLRLINLIEEKEVCVCFLVEVLGTNQPKISRHLSYLRRIGLVESRKEGKWAHYRIRIPSDSQVASIFNQVRGVLDEDLQMKEDRRRLKQIYDQIKKALVPLNTNSSLKNNPDYSVIL